eukprot:1145787-Prymnesium_polylepis.1
MGKLAEVLQLQRKLEPAEPLIVEALDGMRKALAVARQQKRDSATVLEQVSRGGRAVGRGGRVGRRGSPVCGSPSVGRLGSPSVFGSPGVWVAWCVGRRVCGSLVGGSPGVWVAWRVNTRTTHTNNNPTTSTCHTGRHSHTHAHTRTHAHARAYPQRSTARDAPAAIADVRRRPLSSPRALGRHRAARRAAAQDILALLTQLCLLLIERGEAKRATPLLTEALAGRRRTFGANDQVTLRLQTELAGVLHDAGKHAEARACLGDALSTAHAVCSEDDPLVHQ